MSTMVFIKMFMEGVLKNQMVDEMLVLGQLQSLENLNDKIKLEIAEEYRSVSE